MMIFSFFDSPLMSAPGSGHNALVVFGFKCLFIPSLDKISKYFTGGLRWQLGEKHSLLFFQPCGKLIILWEVVILGELLEFVFLRDDKYTFWSQNQNVRAYTINTNSSPIQNYTDQISKSYHVTNVHYFCLKFIFLNVTKQYWYQDATKQKLSHFKHFDSF